MSRLPNNPPPNKSILSFMMQQSSSDRQTGLTPPNVSPEHRSTSNDHDDNIESLFARMANFLSTPNHHLPNQHTSPYDESAPPMTMGAQRRNDFLNAHPYLVAQHVDNRAIPERYRLAINSARSSDAKTRADIINFNSSVINSTFRGRDLSDPLFFRPPTRSHSSQQHQQQPTINPFSTQNSYTSPYGSLSSSSLEERFQTDSSLEENLLRHRLQQPFQNPHHIDPTLAALIKKLSSDSDSSSSSSSSTFSSPPKSKVESKVSPTEPASTHSLPRQPTSTTSEQKQLPALAAVSHSIATPTPTASWRLDEKDEKSKLAAIFAEFKSPYTDRHALLNRQANANDLGAIAVLIRNYYYGIDVFSIKTGFPSSEYKKWIEQLISSQQGTAYALWAQGILCLVSISRNPQQAMVCFEQALTLDANFSFAQTSLGECLSDKVTVMLEEKIPSDHKRAGELFAAAATARDPVAEYHMGDLSNDDTALEWYKKSATKGYSEGLYRYGCSLFRSYQSSKERALFLEARNNLLLAQDFGSSSASVFLNYSFKQ